MLSSSPDNTPMLIIKYQLIYTLLVVSQLDHKYPVLSLEASIAKKINGILFGRLMHAQGRETGSFVDGERNKYVVWSTLQIYTRSWEATWERRRLIYMHV